eukprot:6212229-Pleurochrysis_carterae.AAC.2
MADKCSRASRQPKIGNVRRKVRNVRGIRRLGFQQWRLSTIGQNNGNSFWTHPPYPVQYKCCLAWTLRRAAAHPYYAQLGAASLARSQSHAISADCTQLGAPPLPRSRSPTISAAPVFLCIDISSNLVRSHNLKTGELHLMDWHYLPLSLWTQPNSHLYAVYRVLFCSAIPWYFFVCRGIVTRGRPGGGGPLRCLGALD